MSRSSTISWWFEEWTNAEHASEPAVTETINGVVAPLNACVFAVLLSTLMLGAASKTDPGPSPGVEDEVKATKLLP